MKNNDDEILRRIRQHREEVRRKLAQMEEDNDDETPAFVEDTQKKIADSNTSIILHLHKLLKIGMTCLFYLFVIFIAFSIAMLMYMLVSYVGYVANNEQALKEFLTQIWTILSGAFVVVFFQFIISIGKKISSNGHENR